MTDPYYNDPKNRDPNFNPDLDPGRGLNRARDPSVRDPALPKRPRSGTAFPNPNEAPVSGQPGVDPEKVIVQASYRVGFKAPVPGGLAPGELYIEMTPAEEGGAPRLWIGTIPDTGFKGDIASMVPAGVELPDPEPPQTQAPVNVDVPYLSPDGASVGDTLNCTMGNWNNVPSEYFYSWKRDGGPLTGSGNSYVVADGDAGHAITCVVTAQNAIGTTTAPPSNAVSIPASGGTGFQQAETAQGVRQ